MDKIKLIHGDCLKEMKHIPNGLVDLILTDPPYNISKDNNFHTMGRKGIDFGSWDKNADILSFISEIPRILKKDGSVIVFNDWKNLGDISNECEKYGLITKDLIRWIKANPMPRNTNRRYVTDFECAVWFTNKNARWAFNKKSETYDRPIYKGPLTSVSERVGHPTQKPVYLMEAIIKTHSNELDTVLDMFMGSGSTGVACMNTNRNFIGIEKDEKYFKIAEERIKIETF